MTPSFFFHSLRWAILTLIVEGLSETLKMKYFLLDSLTCFKIEDTFWAFWRTVLFCLRSCFFPPTLWLSLLKNLVCWFVFPTWSARLSGKKIPESFLTSVTDQPESWGIWDFEIIFTESQWFCSYYIYYLLSTWLVIMSVRIKIISSEFLEQISTDRMIFC